MSAAECGPAVCLISCGGGYGKFDVGKWLCPLFNVNDFYQLEHLWKATGRHHAGIIVAAVVEDLGELLRRVQRHLDTIGPDVQRDTLQRLARE